jgi:hypothetical protein
MLTQEEAAEIKVLMQRGAVIREMAQATEFAQYDPVLSAGDVCQAVCAEASVPQSLIRRGYVLERIDAALLH